MASEDDNGGRRVVLALPCPTTWVPCMGAGGPFLPSFTSCSRLHSTACGPRLPDSSPRTSTRTWRTTRLCSSTKTSRCVSLAALPSSSFGFLGQAGLSGSAHGQLLPHQLHISSAVALGAAALLPSGRLPGGHPPFSPLPTLMPTAQSVIRLQPLRIKSVRTSVSND